MTAAIIEFRAFQMRTDAKEYVRRVVEYGHECASLWSMDRVNKGEERMFRQFVSEEMRRKGFVVS